MADSVEISAKYGVPPEGKILCICRKAMDKSGKDLFGFIKCAFGIGGCNGWLHLACCSDLCDKSPHEVDLLSRKGYKCVMCKAETIKQLGRHTHASSSSRKNNRTGSVDSETNTAGVEQPALTLLSDTDRDELRNLLGNIPASSELREKRRSLLCKFYLQSSAMFQHGHRLPWAAKNKLPVDALSRKRKYVKSQPSDGLTTENRLFRAQQIHQHQLQEHYYSILQKQYLTNLQTMHQLMIQNKLHPKEGLGLGALETSKKFRINSSLSMNQWMYHLREEVQNKFSDEFRGKELPRLQIDAFLLFLQKFEAASLPIQHQSTASKPIVMDSSSINAVLSSESLAPMLLRWIALLAHALPGLYSHAQHHGCFIEEIDAFIELGQNAAIQHDISVSAHPAQGKDLHSKTISVLHRFKTQGMDLIHETNVVLSKIAACFEQIQINGDAREHSRLNLSSERHDAEASFAHFLDCAYQTHSLLGVEHPGLMLVIRVFKWAFDCYLTLEKTKDADVNGELNTAAINTTCIKLHNDSASLMKSVSHIPAAYNAESVQNIVFNLIRFWHKKVPLRILSFPTNVLQARSNSLAVADTLRNMARRQLFEPIIFASPREGETSSSISKSPLSFESELARDYAHTGGAKRPRTSANSDSKELPSAATATSKARTEVITHTDRIIQHAAPWELHATQATLGIPVTNPVEIAGHHSKTISDKRREDIVHKYATEQDMALTDAAEPLLISGYDPSMEL